MTRMKGVLLIAMQVKTTIRHVIGIGLRRISEILLQDYTDEVVTPSQPEPPPVQEVQVPSPVIQTSSGHDPTKHKTFYVAASGILKAMLKEPDNFFTVKALEPEVQCSPSSIRSACKKLVEMGILSSSSEGYPANYKILDRDLAAIRLTEYESYLGQWLPISEAETQTDVRVHGDNQDFDSSAIRSED